MDIDSTIKLEQVFPLPTSLNGDQLLLDFDHSKYGDVVFKLACKYNYPHVIEKILTYTDTATMRLLEYCWLDGLNDACKYHYVEIVDKLLSKQIVLQKLKNEIFTLDENRVISRAMIPLIKKILKDKYDYIKTDEDIKVFLDLI